MVCNSLQHNTRTVEIKFVLGPTTIRKIRYGKYMSSTRYYFFIAFKFLYWAPGKTQMSAPPFG